MAIVTILELRDGNMIHIQSQAQTCIGTGGGEFGLDPLGHRLQRCKTLAGFGGMARPARQGAGWPCRVTARPAVYAPKLNPGELAWGTPGPASPRGRCTPTKN